MIQHLANKIDDPTSFVALVKSSHIWIYPMHLSIFTQVQPYEVLYLLFVKRIVHPSYKIFRSISDVMASPRWNQVELMGIWIREEKLVSV